MLTEHIYVFSRMVLNDSHMFAQLMAASAPVLNQTEAILYDTLMGVWWEKVIPLLKIIPQNYSDLSR